jgi:hypothetical protein
VSGATIPVGFLVPVRIRFAGYPWPSPLRAWLISYTETVDLRGRPIASALVAMREPVPFGGIPAGRILNVQTESIELDDESPPAGET